MTEWTLTAIVPSGNGECMEYQIECGPKDTAEKLKKKVEKLCSIPVDDQELFCKNNDSEECKQKWLNEEQTLEAQEVVDGAMVTIGVHGLTTGDDVEFDPETGEPVAKDAVQNSMSTKGDSSYYFAHNRKSDLTEEQRIVSGGVPQKIAEGETQAIPTTEAMPLSAAMFDEFSEEPGRPRKAIKNYAWGDEKEVVKIYISKEGEPEAIEVAGDGKSGQCEAKFLPKALRLIVHGPQLDLCFLVERLYYEIIPEESSIRVSRDKRITITLKKKENFTWLKLIKPE
jgi:hypothetical protein